MCWKEKANGEAAHLTVVTESSRNHGTLMTYTLGSLSAEEQGSSPHLHTCTSGCRLCITTLTFRCSTLARDADPKRLVDLKMTSDDISDTLKPEILSLESR